MRFLRNGMTVQGRAPFAINTDLEERTGKMDNATFGITVTVVGMGGTLLTLWLISLMVVLLKKIFPFAEGEGPKKADR
jgi:hypothetical protein